MKKLVAGIAISAVFVYFTLRGVRYENVLSGLGGARYGFLLPALLLNLAVAVLRSLRWGIILSPVRRVGQRELFPITCVGFMSVVLVPMRMGEFVRPYLVSSRGLAPFSSTLATVFVERVLDVMTILGIFVLVLIGSDLPSWLVKSGYTALAVFAVMLVLMGVLYFRTGAALKAMGPVLRVLPRRLDQRIEDLIRRFVHGFRIIASPGRLLATAALSALIWGFTGLAVYSLFYFQGLGLPALAAFIVLVVNVIGISLPTAPGMLGNFQYSCIVALAIFGVQKDAAFAFSMVYYFLGVGTVIALGLAFLPYVRISPREIYENIRKGLRGA